MCLCAMTMMSCPVNLIHEAESDELAKAKIVQFSISHERRLVPISMEEIPFGSLKFFRWPDKWPYSVELEVDGKVNSVINLIKGGESHEKE
jgi:hypothetical protein